MLFLMKTWLLLQISTICHTGSTSAWASPSCLALTAASYCPILPIIALPRFKHSHMFSNIRKLAPSWRPSVVTWLPPVVTIPSNSHGIMDFTTFSQHHEKKGAFFWNLCVKVFPRFRNFSEVPTWPRDLKCQIESRGWNLKNCQNYLSTNTLGIWTSWRGLFPSFSAWLRFRIFKKENN